MTGWYSPRPRVGCLGTTRLLPCHEAASAPTPPSRAHPAFLRIHTRPGCPGTARPGSPLPCPAHTRRLKPPAPIANILCLSRKHHHGWEKASSPLQNQGLGCSAGSLSVPPALLRVCFFFFFFLISNRQLKKEKQTNKQTTFCPRRFRLTDGEKASGRTLPPASTFAAGEPTAVMASATVPRGCGAGRGAPACRTGFVVSSSSSQTTCVARMMNYDDADFL